MGPVTKIMIVDDHEVVRAGVRRILEARSRWQVVAEAAEAQDAMVKALALKPDIVIVDYSMPGRSGVDLTRELHVQLPSTEVLVYTMHDSESLVLDVLRAGARGYLLKSDTAQFLEAAIDSLSLHRPFFTCKASKTLVDSFLNRPSTTPCILSHRERGVVQLVAEGHSNKEIASLLNITVKTVETHRASAMRKLDYSSPALLVRYAVRNKIVEP
jgi:DNA-binding NarL/FixJ family response regulator